MYSESMEILPLYRGPEPLLQVRPLMSWNKYTRQRFGVSVSYRIGELKASVKKAARTISNDDVKSSGGEGGGGGE